MVTKHKMEEILEEVKVLSHEGLDEELAQLEHAVAKPTVEHPSEVPFVEETIDLQEIQEMTGVEQEPIIVVRRGRQPARLDCPNCGKPRGRAKGKLLITCGSWDCTKALGLTKLAKPRAVRVK